MRLRETYNNNSSRRTGPVPTSHRPHPRSRSANDALIQNWPKGRDGDAVSEPGVVVRATPLPNLKSSPPAGPAARAVSLGCRATCPRDHDRPLADPLRESYVSRTRSQALRSGLASKHSFSSPFAFCSTNERADTTEKSGVGSGAVGSPDEAKGFAQSTPPAHHSHRDTVMMARSASKPLIASRKRESPHAVYRDRALLPTPAR
jgi:hypothetical protein